MYHINSRFKKNESLMAKFNVETAIKEKYFEMWRASEKERIISKPLGSY